MAYQSKRTLVSLVAGVAIAIAYLVFALGSNAPASNDVRTWAFAMLVCVGVGVVLSIIIQVLFHIVFSIGIAVKNQDKTDEQVESEINNTVREDEMGKTISLKASQSGFICAGLGFLGLLIALAVGAPIVVALNILFGSFVLGSLVSGVVEIVFYERGLI